MDLLSELNEESYISLKHKDNDTIFKVSKNCRKISKFIDTILLVDKNRSDDEIINIGYGSYSDFLYIIKYLDFYKKIEEIEAPKKPLNRDITLKEIFNNEIQLFYEFIYDDKISPNIKYDAIPNISKIIQMANYMDMSILMEKLAAIVAYIIRDKEVMDIIENEMNSKN